MNANKQDAGGLPVFVSSAIERLLSDAYACGMNGDPFDMLNARRVIDASARAYGELCRATPADNAGGLVWYVCTSCMLMVQLPSDTPTLGRCQCSPKGWSLRRAKLPKGYELCRADPAGGVMATGGFLMDEARRKMKDSAPAGGRPYGGDPAEPRDDSDRYDSAPAGSGEELAKWVEGARDYATGGNVRPDDGDEDQEQWDRLTEAAALLRKLQQGAGENSLRAVAKRNLRSLINIGSDDKELMLKCLEELS